MADPYIGEIRIFPYYSFSGEAPYGWLLCNGQIVTINQFQALFAIIQNTYGGNFQQGNFAVPNLMGYAPVGMGQGPGLSSYTLGKNAGAASVTLDLDQTPFHNHGLTVKDGKNQPPAGNSIFVGNPAAADLHLSVSRPNATSNYAIGTGYAASPNAQLASQSLSVAGAGGPHENRQPFLAFLFCIATEGIFPVKGD